MAEKFMCPVCEERTFRYTVGSFDICSNCGWQDDLLQYELPDEEGGANKLSLNQFRAKYYAEKANYEKFGRIKPD